uniref:ADF-H domain-containing protein n=1 Tax=Globodera pallida TaxID=36090 RepID=A0A183BVG7_GLOPA
MSDLLVRNFDFTAKIVSDTDCSTNKFVPLIQLRLYCEDRQKCAQVLIYEFTLPEAREFVLSLDDNNDTEEYRRQH